MKLEPFENYASLNQTERAEQLRWRVDQALNAPGPDLAHAQALISAVLGYEKPWTHTRRVAKQFAHRFGGWQRS